MIRTWTDRLSTKEPKQPCETQAITSNLEPLTQGSGRTSANLNECQYQPLKSSKHPSNIGKIKLGNKQKSILACNLEPRNQMRIDLQIKLDISDLLQHLDKIIFRSVSFNEIITLGSFII